MNQPDLADSLVHALEQLPGVLTANVWFASHDQLRALHIIAAPRASGHIISNAAGRILRRFGLVFDASTIQVALRDSDTWPPPSPPSGKTHATSRVASVGADARAPDLRLADEEPIPRLAGRNATPELLNGAAVERYALPGIRGRTFLGLDGLAIARDGGRVTCSVTVRRDAGSYRGDATELDTEAGRLRAAGRATLKAVETSGHSLALGLEGATMIHAFGRNYVAASVEASLDRRFAILPGLAPVDAARSAEEAACHAVLHAVHELVTDGPPDG